jgi:hypothetical protein
MSETRAGVNWRRWPRGAKSLVDDGHHVAIHSYCILMNLCCSEHVIARLQRSIAWFNRVNQKLEIKSTD